MTKVPLSDPSIHDFSSVERPPCPPSNQNMELRSREKEGGALTGAEKMSWCNQLHQRQKFVYAKASIRGAVIIINWMIKSQSCRYMLVWACSVVLSDEGGSVVIYIQKRQTIRLKNCYLKFLRFGNHSQKIKWPNPLDTNWVRLIPFHGSPKSVHQHVHRQCPRVPLFTHLKEESLVEKSWKKVA